jgi:metal-dependent amidase/aminoacylase/carboxypeptidase family protein
MRRATTQMLVQLRHYLHANPRVSNNEADTAAAIIDFLASNASLFPTHTNVGGGHGLVYEVHGERSVNTNDVREESADRHLHSHVNGHPASNNAAASQPCVLLRADMDALPLVEDSPGLPHASVVRGAHHACGHDGHSVMLAGALMELSARRADFAGRVVAVFQPAEETGDGARQVCDVVCGLMVCVRLALPAGCFADGGAVGGRLPHCVASA